MKIDEIVKIVNGKLLSGDKETKVLGYQQDSRHIQEGDLYIPIVGERFNGHDFIQESLQKGAVASFTNYDKGYTGYAVIQVSDTLKALQQLAHYVREKSNAKVVGITGSVGKTSTKDMIYSVVKQKYKTLKTLGNYNNDIGLPLTILRHTNEEVMVLEMGMNHLQEISLLSKIATPDIAVITNVGTAHIGELESRENILKAKMEIVDGMNEGVLIINHDNDMLQTIKGERIPILTVGIHDADFQAQDIVLYEEYSTFNILFNNQLQTIRVPVQGQHFVTNALLAIAVGIQLGIPIEDCIRGVETFTLTKNRMDIVTLKNEIKIIDGTYNASEDSMKSSIDVLANYQGRKICVLADMLEMGEYAKQLHRSVGSYVANANIDMLICVGKDAKYMIEAANQEGMKDTILFENNCEVFTYLENILDDGDIVLIKGSNGMRLKEIVDSLKEKWA